MEFKKAVLEIAEEDWVVLQKRERSGEMRETARQWAEVCYVPNAIGRSKTRRDRSIDIWPFGTKELCIARGLRWNEKSPPSAEAYK